MEIIPFLCQTGKKIYLLQCHRILGISLYVPLLLKVDGLQQNYDPLKAKIRWVSLISKVTKVPETMSCLFTLRYHLIWLFSDQLTFLFSKLLSTLKI